MRMEELYSEIELEKVKSEPETTPTPKSKRAFPPLGRQPSASQTSGDYVLDSGHTAPPAPFVGPKRAYPSLEPPQIPRERNPPRILNLDDLVARGFHPRTADDAEAKIWMPDPHHPIIDLPEVDHERIERIQNIGELGIMDKLQCGKWHCFACRAPIQGMGRPPSLCKDCKHYSKQDQLKHCTVCFIRIARNYSTRCIECWYLPGCEQWLMFQEYLPPLLIEPYGPSEQDKCIKCKGNCFRYKWKVMRCKDWLRQDIVFHCAFCWSRGMLIGRKHLVPDSRTTQDSPRRSTLLLPWTSEDRLCPVCESGPMWTPINPEVLIQVLEKYRTCQFVIEKQVAVSPEYEFRYFPEVRDKVKMISTGWTMSFTPAWFIRCPEAAKKARLLPQPCKVVEGVWFEKDVGSVPWPERSRTPSPDPTPRRKRRARTKAKATRTSVPPVQGTRFDLPTPNAEPLRMVQVPNWRLKRMKRARARQDRDHKAYRQGLVDAGAISGRYNPDSEAGFPTTGRHYQPKDQIQVIGRPQLIPRGQLRILHSGELEGDWTVEEHQGWCGQNCPCCRSVHQEWSGTCHECDHRRVEKDHYVKLRERARETNFPYSDSEVE